MKIMVTGSSGFLGSNFIKLLSPKDNIYLIWNRNIPVYKKGCNIIECNLLDLEEQKRLIQEYKPEYLIHFAWFTKPVEYWNSLANYDWLIASMNLLNLFKENGGKRVIFIGSCAEYDWSYGYLTEYITPLRGNTIYSFCKRQLGEFFNDYCENNDLSGAYCRIFYTFGEYENINRLIPEIIMNNGEHNKTILDKEIDIMYIGDVVKVLYNILLNKEAIGNINISTDKGAHIKDIIKYIFKRMNINKNIDYFDSGIKIIGNNKKMREFYKGHIHNFKYGIDKTLKYWREKCL